jgi:hypothetical protein
VVQGKKPPLGGSFAFLDSIGSALICANQRQILDFLCVLCILCGSKVLGFSTVTVWQFWHFWQLPGGYLHTSPSQCFPRQKILLAWEAGRLRLPTGNSSFRPWSPGFQTADLQTFDLQIFRPLISDLWTFGHLVDSQSGAQGV